MSIRTAIIISGSCNPYHMKVGDNIYECKRKIESGATSEVYISNDNKYVFKKIIKYDECDVFKREVYILKLLNTSVDWAPKLLCYDDISKTIMMKYCGDPLTYSNKPNDFVHQARTILKDLSDLNIQHNDIKINGEVLVLDNKIFLCDYGWASINNSFDCGQNFWNGKKDAGVLVDDRVLDYFSLLEKERLKKKRLNAMIQHMRNIRHINKSNRWKIKYVIK